MASYCDENKSGADRAGGSKVNQSKSKWGGACLKIGDGARMPALRAECFTRRCHLEEFLGVSMYLCPYIKADVFTTGDKSPDRKNKSALIRIHTADPNNWWCDSPQQLVICFATTTGGMVY